MATISSKSFTTDNAKVRAAKGPLVRVEISPGRFVKMHEADAIEAGHIEPKRKPPQENKMRPPAEDKGTEAPGAKESAQMVAADDFTTITGVGKATARALNAAGIVTFEQLRAADVERIVNANAAKAIENWREEANG